MMRKGWMSFVFALILLFAFSTYGDEWGVITIPPEKPIKIGLGAMLTGDYASLGIDIRYGAEMAVQEKGMIDGHPILLQAEDDGCAGPPSVAIAEKLCNDPLIVGLVGYMCSGGSKPASDIHNKYKVVMVSPSSTALELTARNIPIFFRTCWNDKIQAKRAADFTISRQWLKIAVIHDKSDYGQSLAQDFADNVRAYSLSPKLLDGSGSVSLGEPVAVRTQNERKVPETWNRPFERFVNQYLLRSIGKMIVATDDICDSHIMIVHNHSYLINR